MRVTCRQDSKKSWALHMKRQAAREKKAAAHEGKGRRGRWHDRAGGEGGSTKGGASQVMYGVRDKLLPLQKVAGAWRCGGRVGGWEEGCGRRVV